MLKEIGNFINLADILVALIFVRTIWIGLIKGLSSEFFKVLNVFVTSFIALHYFTALAVFFGKHLSIPLVQLELLAFIVIWGVITFIFRIVREAWVVSVNPEGKVILGQRIGGIILAIPRVGLISGLLFFMIFLSGNPFLNRQVRNSWLGFHFQDTSFRVYDLFYDGFIHKVFPNEEKNPALLKVKDRYKPKTK